MKINWLRVQNFRSVLDSGVCYLDSAITVLAGKNESGKTNILRALECFGNNKYTDVDNMQDIQNPDSPKVTVSFEVS